MQSFLITTLVSSLSTLVITIPSFVQSVEPSTRKQAWKNVEPLLQVYNWTGQWKKGVSDNFGPKTKIAQKLPNFCIQTSFDLVNAQDP